MFKPLILLVFLNLNSQLMAQQTYLALGDSYTIGEGLGIQKSWPYQLTDQLNKNGFNIQNIAIIAKTGWRTDELIEAIDKKLTDDKKFDIVSLLIGVNNQYQGKPLREYKKEFKKLLKIAITKSKHQSQGVFVISIPDYGVTPFAEEKNKTQAIKDLKLYNKFAEKQCQKQGIPFYNITPLSAQLSISKDMLTEDLLHPSAKQYQAWIEQFSPKLIKHLKTL